MSQSLNQSIDGQPIKLALTSIPLHQSKIGTISKVALVVSNIDSTTKIMSFEIDSGETMEVSIPANSSIEIPEILIQNSSVLSAFADVAEVVRVMGRVKVTG